MCNYEVLLKNELTLVHIIKITATMPNR